MPEELGPLLHDLIRREGAIRFDRFMREALYHPTLGYYSSGRAEIGRRGDYFTSVSVGPLFGKMLVAQFAEVWEKLGRPSEFSLVEQGAHHGEFAGDVLAEAPRTSADFFRALRYQVVEPFPVLRERQQAALSNFSGKVEWCDSLETLPKFSGVHFSNELLDAFPLRLFLGEGGEWRERFVDSGINGFQFVERPADPDALAKLPPAPEQHCETELNFAAEDWLDALASKLQRGLILIADYGFVRDALFGRSNGTLQAYRAHRAQGSPLENPGATDLTAHVEWTGLVAHAQALGLTIAGFTDQHHFLTGLLATFPALTTAAAQTPRALQTLLHPEFLGTRFQFLGLTKSLSAKDSLGGFRFARDARSTLRLGRDLSG